MTKIGSNDGGRPTQDREAKEPATQSEEKPQAEDAVTKELEEPKALKEEPPRDEISSEDLAVLAALAGEQFAQDCVDMVKSADHEDSQIKKATAEPTDDREKRGKIHQEVRRIFNSRIETTTNDSGTIIANLVPRRGGAKRRPRGGRNNNKHREEKPAGDYLHFTLYKDNRDTMDAVNQISRMLRVKPQVIGYAGTKDRRASTAQRCSIRYIRDRALAGINGKLRGVVTGDYKYKQVPIHLGQLMGNEFVITVKNCKMTGGSQTTPMPERLEALRTNVQSAMDHMAEHGWINYFGHQRFGTHEIGTHEVGKLILGEKYEEAVRALLSFDPKIAEKAEAGEVPEEMSKRDEYLRAQACMLFLTGKDCDRAEKIIPRRFGAENCILRHLNRGGVQSRKDFIGALVHITRGLRTMYLHAYQSHIWNHAASKRWELHGDKVVEGDLVIAETEATPVFGGQDQDGDDIINPIEDEDERTERARPLTAEEASSGRYTIHDIVLPSPGYEVLYPSNSIGDFYAEFMSKEENGGLDPAKMRRARREFSLPGRYRKLLKKFLAVPSVEFKEYVDDMEQMHPTDLDIVREAAAKTGSGKRGRESLGGEPASKKLLNEDGDVVMKEPEATEELKAPVDSEKKIAAVVKFQLGSSAYATVTLRELMGDPPEDVSE